MAAELCVRSTRRRRRLRNAHTSWSRTCSARGASTRRTSSHGRRGGARRRTASRSTSPTSSPSPCATGSPRCWACRLDRVRVVGHHIGGGFGAKLDLGLEPHAALLAQADGPAGEARAHAPGGPVDVPSRENAIVRIRTAVSQEGELLARDAEVLLDAGAYAGDAPYLVSIPLHPHGLVYRIGPTRVRARAVYTEHDTDGRVPGGERDLPRVRARAAPRSDRATARDGPSGAAPPQPDAGRRPAADRAAAAGRLDPARGLRRRRARRSVAGGLGRGQHRPPVRADSPRRGHGGRGLAHQPAPGIGEVRLEDDGTVAVVTAATENGSGAVAMGVTQIVAEELGVPPDDGAHRVARHVGRRATTPARRDRAPRTSSAAPPAPPRQRCGGSCSRSPPSCWRRRRTTSRSWTAPSACEVRRVSRIPLADRGARPRRPARRAHHRERGRTRRRNPPTTRPVPPGLLFPTFPTPTYHVHLAEVEVDPVTGVVTVVRYVVAQEVGRAINPVGRHRPDPGWRDAGPRLRALRGSRDRP